jgi:hypothetical protein
MHRSPIRGSLAIPPSTGIGPAKNGARSLVKAIDRFEGKARPTWRFRALIQGNQIASQASYFKRRNSPAKAGIESMLVKDDDYENSWRTKHQ